MASNAGPYTIRRIRRHDLSHIAINPSSISPIANMQQMMVLVRTLPLTPAISIPENDRGYTLIPIRKGSRFAYETAVWMLGKFPLG